MGQWWNGLDGGGVGWILEWWSTCLLKIVTEKLLVLSTTLSFKIT